MKGIRPVMKKEMRHIFRDPKSLIIIFIMPVLMIFIYGYAISFDLNNINIGIVDHSGSDLSKKFTKKFLNNQYYTRVFPGRGEPGTIENFEWMLKTGEIDEMLIIPPDFSEKIKAGIPSDVGFVIDGSDSNTANIIYQYNEMVIFDFLRDYQNISDVLKVNTKIHFNIELKSAYFFIPGLIAVLLLMISALLTSLSISKEKESGSIDLLFISPVRSYEIIIGKTVAYIFVALAVEAIILVFSRFWFGMPVRGNLLVLLGFSLVYIFTGLSLGIMISMISPDQKTSMLATLLITMLPSIMLSGFIFPIESLGAVLQWLSGIVPATYFLKIIRGVVMKGASVSDFIFEGVVLFIMSAVLIFAAVTAFSKLRKAAS